ncbi:prepilin peptidase [Cryobacterium adonitolivorans]|uniref:Prepilin leader peptidase/N-methyltransferase n=1 Tax=Cryobacterium adonitolivorans TaxID=1259189 RepID=A0A4R8VYE0_9MICO|nr:A24 family peptidase [Cryobacterium adonitolivorans]TFB96790.1 prepilin peptidase [Cryobacterium adonitolivorans]
MFVGIFGLLIGSFLNVVIFRVPAGRSIVFPASSCGACGATIRPWDNIPVLSWLLLRGRCRMCRTWISARYPLVEFGTAAFFAIVAWWTVTASPSKGVFAETLLIITPFLFLAAVSVALAMIDLDTHTLPNRIVLPAYLVAALLLTAAGLFIGEPGRLLAAAIGGMSLFTAYLLMALCYPSGMGLGDVKLAGLLGLYLGWLGWAPLIVGAFAAFLLGGIFALLLLVTGRADRKSGIPFGPWMLVGAWLGIFYGEQVATGYLSLFGLA